MIYTGMTARAMRIAYAAHAGQLDKSGVPYVFHPFHVAEQMEDEVSTAVALLHDVAEDTAWSLEQLSAHFPEEVIRPLRLLTHDPRIPYLDYVRTLSRDPVARKVKLADLAHNLDETRLQGKRLDAEHRARYLAAGEILRNASENPGNPSEGVDKLEPLP